MLVGKTPNGILRGFGLSWFFLVHSAELCRKQLERIINHYQLSKIMIRYQYFAPSQGSVLFYSSLSQTQWLFHPKFA